MEFSLWEIVASVYTFIQMVFLATYVIHRAKYRDYGLTFNFMMGLFLVSWVWPFYYLNFVQKLKEVFK